ncbi:Phytochelatin synthase [Legionella massiliensis]|uniref:glutathione gamma-glutamylcysteinyltransferase n=2 Tax=Legionella massiliensis TaxID=1034943 RepID=A0A078KXK0_9GAMM|nr:Phytochelatin synthase [Legionella massiliensis]CEE12171.1 Phytochelatin synthase [Legionella massiliensis]
MLDIYKKGFRQQHEATCGPASIILSATGLGLEKKEESEWIDKRFKRWLPVHEFLDRGMALHELLFISELVYAGKISLTLYRSYEENYAIFIDEIKNAFQTRNAVLVVNFLQADFIKGLSSDSKGNPHYSPLVAWKTKENEVLLCDVDQAIQEPYWVKIDAIFQSMAKYNPAYNLPRGWLVLKKR